MAALLVSELVANAVVHACTPAVVILSRSENNLRVDVIDLGNSRLVVEPDRQLGDGGRGLPFVLGKPSGSLSKHRTRPVRGLKHSCSFGAHGQWRPATSKPSSSGQIGPARAQVGYGVVDFGPVAMDRAGSPGMTRSLAGATAWLVPRGRRCWPAWPRYRSRQDRLRHQVGMRPHPFE